MDIKADRYKCLSSQACYIFLLFMKKHIGIAITVLNEMSKILNQMNVSIFYMLYSKTWIIYQTHCLGDYLKLSGSFELNDYDDMIP